MTTGYNRAELARLDSDLLSLAPGPTAPIVKAITMAASDTGMLVNFEFRKKHTLIFYFNCAVAVQFFVPIYESGVSEGWWKADTRFQRNEELMIPTTDDYSTALEVKSLTTAPAGRGILANLTDGNSSFVIYLPKEIASELLLGIEMAGNQVEWWDDEFGLLPTGQRPG